MKTAVLAIFAAGVFAAAGYLPVEAQYYSYSPGYYVAVPPQYYNSPAPRPAGPGTTFFYRLAPNPKIYKQWNQHNRYNDFQESLRSPFNPESDLSYMLRTF